MTLDEKAERRSRTLGRRARFSFGLVLLALVFTLGVGLGAALAPAMSPSHSQAAPSPAASVSVFGEAWDIVHQHYVDPTAIDDQKMLVAAISGMLETLGDQGHTRYLTADELRMHAEELSGTYTGVGIQIEERDGNIVVVTPLDNTPAQEAGIRPGDVLIEIDGQSAQGLGLDEVVRRVRGPEGTSVTLVFQRPGQREPIQVTLVRETIRISPVNWTMLPGQIAHIRLSQFSSGATDDLKRAIAGAQAAGAVGIVLDLRNNPGGLVNEAIGVASQFLPPNSTVFLSQVRSGDREEYRTEVSASPTDLPMVVLINGGTASAGEIVAGAIQENKRAPLVGERTFGTGTVLTEFRLQDGSAILLGTELWLTPSGRQIWRNGIEPDVRVSLPPEVQPAMPVGGKPLSEEAMAQDVQLQAALRILQGYPALGTSAPRPGCLRCE